MQLKIQRKSEGAIWPKYATEGAACFDIAAPFSDDPPGEQHGCTWPVSELGTTFIRTGWAFEIPDGHVMLMFSRSGHTKSQLRLANCVGVIDADYRGEVQIPMTCDSPDQHRQICSGERIAQCMVIPVEQVEFVLADQLSETKRGDGGFGSTGR